MEEAKWFENLKICTDADIALVVRIQESGVRIYKGLLVWYLSSQGEMAPVISRFFNNSDSCILTTCTMLLLLIRSKKKWAVETATTQTKPACAGSKLVIFH